MKVPHSMKENCHFKGKLHRMSVLNEECLGFAFLLNNFFSFYVMHKLHTMLFQSIRFVMSPLSICPTT